MYSWLQPALDEGAEVVTATNRLARDLHSASQQSMLAAGQRAWRTPRILSWSAWLRTLLRGAGVPVRLPLRLEPAASAVLWERLLRETAHERLLNTAGAVRQMQQAWQRLQDWCVSTGELVASATSEDQQLFAAVATAYERELADNDWMDDAQLAVRVAELVRDGFIDCPSVLVHAGFDRLTPAVERLFAALAGRRCRIRAAPVPDRRQSLQLVEAADAEAELRAAGRWAAGELAANPSARIAVVRASLESGAERSARILREGYVPGWQYGDHARRFAVNVSYGRRLSDYPMVGTALLWLAWAQRGLDSREVGLLLRSPFTGGADAAGRHRLETRLRRLPDRSWSPQRLAAVLVSLAGDERAPAWAARLAAVADLAREGTMAASPAAWARRIDAFLRGLGWPGDRVLDSEEFQLLDRWRVLLNELALLEPVRPRLRFSEAAARLATLAGDTLFQPEAADATLQLLGPLEAAGMEFDCIWFANLEAGEWPASARPMPLVSRALQRRLGMPDATPSDTLEHARRILARLAASAKSVVLSWPRSERDAALVPSPLLDAWRGSSSTDATDPGWFAATLCGRPLRREEADPAPPLAVGERVRGGAYTVQSQFTEPFTAFAIGRLGVRAMPAIEVGLSASLRGTIVHRALGVLLPAGLSQAEMRSWQAGERARRVASAVESALSMHFRHADTVVERLLSLERRRLERLLQLFLDAELARPAFEIRAVETALRLVRRGVALDLRVDRMDRLHDGSLLVIDYKTGAPKRLLTAQGTPAEWQTVVYAMALDEPVGGLALVNLDSRGIVYRGIGADLPWNALGHDEWALRLAGWSHSVDEALGCIAAGDARVNVALSASRSRPLNVLSRAEALKREA